MSELAAQQNTDNADDDDPLIQQVKVVEALTRLATSLKDLNDHESPPVLSHYRHMPEVATQSYDLLQQGAQLVHGTSTKYTLLAKLDVKEQSRMTQDLLRGCQLLGTGCVVLHDDQSGCARSTRHHCKQAVRAIVHTVIQLVEVWLTAGDEVWEKGNNLGAQKTGAVWEMCNVILQRKLPQGNRNAMRRDLLVFIRDCAETSQEFQEMIDLGPSLREENEEEMNGGNKYERNADEWDDLIMGDGDGQFSAKELPVAEACLYLVKNSRGCVKLALQAIEAIGQQLAERIESPEDKAKLSWISKLHDLARHVGEGVTDLGTTMYPPLQMQNLDAQVDRQSSAVQLVVDFITDGAIIAKDGDDINEIKLEFPEDVNDLLSKVRHALETRRKEAEDAIHSCDSE